nr:helicase RepA family protein [Escherichia coli]
MTVVTTADTSQLYALAARHGLKLHGPLTVNELGLDYRIVIATVDDGRRCSLPNIMAPEWFDGLKRAAEGRRLMVLDTLRRFHIEEENASGPMAQVIGRMEAIAADTGCSIVFLHHASKGAAMMGAGDQQQASRGSSVLVDNIRWQSYLSSMTSAEAEEWGVDDDQRRFFVRFGVSKANYGAPFADRWFRRHDGGVLKPAVLERQRKSKGVPRGEA